MKDVSGFLPIDSYFTEIQHTLDSFMWWNMVMYCLANLLI